MGLILLSIAISYIIASYAAEKIHKKPTASQGAKPQPPKAPAGGTPKPQPAVRSEQSG